jgi:hypothetical protein
MRYVVSHASGAPLIGPAGLDVDLSLQDALALAGRLIVEGRQDVFIADGNGKQIGGEDLAACCRGEKTLTPDLRAV